MNLIELAVTNHCIVFQVFFSKSQNNLSNFVRHCGETDRPVIIRVFFLALLENWGYVCHLPVDWDLS